MSGMYCEANALRKHVGMVLAAVGELPDGTTALGFHQVGYPLRPWRWVSTVTGITWDEWIGGHTPTSRRHPGPKLDLADWQQHQDDIGAEANERELRQEYEQ